MSGVAEFWDLLQGAMGLKVASFCPCVHSFYSVCEHTSHSSSFQLYFESFLSSNELPQE